MKHKPKKTVKSQYASQAINISSIEAKLAS